MSKRLIVYKLLRRTKSKSIVRRYITMYKNDLQFQLEVKSYHDMKRRSYT